MADSFGSALRSFWHTMTSYDRHASHNSPYRTGQHQPLPQSRHAPLTSIATDAADSQTDLTLTNPVNGTGGTGGGAAAAAAAADSEQGGPTVVQPAYQPGMRSTMHRARSDDGAGGGNPRGEIQMQSFSEGLPPPPPVGHSWRRIDRWAEDNYEELWDNLGEPCTQNDINELEHELDCTLPMEVRESLQVHDGQERGGLPTGIIFGCMLLDCEEIVQEWQNWRKVSEDYLNRPSAVDAPTPVVPSKAFGGPPSSSSAAAAAAPSPQQQSLANPMWREELAARQDSQPPNAIQKSYCNVAWIPLARDWGGNCLAVDLAPGPAGRWGQVILMGRDYDCKYVVARSWAAFLANVADDIASPKVFVEEESGELKLREFRQPGVEPAYMNILRWRVDQKYGRKGPRRRSAGAGGAAAPANSTNSHGGGGDARANNGMPPAPSRPSPYSSPAASVAGGGGGGGVDGDRGRSAHRYSNGGTMSPRGTISSPLARVAEEAPAAVKVHTSNPASRKNSLVADKLLPVADAGEDDDRETLLGGPADAAPPADELAPATPAASDKENAGRKAFATGLGVKNLDVDEEDGMKAVEL